MMDCRPRRRPPPSSRITVVLLVLALSAGLSAALTLTRIVHLRSGKLQGIVVRNKMSRPVEIFLGVPYATPPVGVNRFSPTRSVPPWAGVRLCDRPAPVCPQQPPNLTAAAHGWMSRGRLAALHRLAPFLQDYSEDCLYLNVYAPAYETFGERIISFRGSVNWPPRSCDITPTDFFLWGYVKSQVYADKPQTLNDLEANIHRVIGGIQPQLLERMKKEGELSPVLVFVHGSEDFSSGSGNPFDGRVLAGYTSIVVVTINYRLGALGFLNLNNDPDSRPRIANSGLMDQIAALQWVQQNIDKFGGDPTRVTVAGHGTGAACVHFLAISPAVMAGLFHRVLLLSGSALSSWALVEDPVSAATVLASQVNCTDHVDVVGCLQEVPVEEILKADVRPPAFLHSFGPSLDGVVVRPGYSGDHEDYAAREVDVMLGVVTAEAIGWFTSSDLQAGFDHSRRDRILRTYVRNAYEYHLPEIFVTIVNEYTDWERTVVHPVNTRDATVAALSDAQYVAPVVKTADLFSSASRGATYFYVFDHQTKHGDYAQRLGVAHGEELAYLFGAPLVDQLGHFPRNFTRAEVALAEGFMTSVANFVRVGNPNSKESKDQFLPVSKEKNRFRSLTWDQYDSTHQKYLDISLRPKTKNHFRSHHLSIWLQLIPELHRAGMEDVHTRHNRFHNHHDLELYTGLVRPDPRRENVTVSEVILPITTMETMVTTCVNLYTTRGYRNSSDSDADIREVTYLPILTMTVTIGVSLLVLNLLVCAAVYYQRDKTRIELKALEQQKRLRTQHGLKHSTSVVLDMDTESPIMVLTHLPSKNGSVKSLGPLIPPAPSPPQMPRPKRSSIPAAAISEITV
ncbi:neuroligin-4, X-linked-like [Macrosteles quadrilineatus]|uniref:neuroligin-4, X-linked-like n=1 Tax=Macrosteles quadrilineatus TaxID=74068 RepID=UPI0023E1D496|nr:neuroligin-4, X-linked-like [Macrosteles quadrilineatus]